MGDLENKYIIKIEIRSGMCDDRFGEMGEQTVTHGAQLSGVCEVEEKRGRRERYLLAAVNGKKRPGKNMILKIRYDERQYADQVHRVSLKARSRRSLAHRYKSTQYRGGNITSKVAIYNTSQVVI